jgi:hypothetical protein
LSGQKLCQPVENLAAYRVRFFRVRRAHLPTIP